MNTHDIEIELPPEFRKGNDILFTQATIKRERMEEILREAIEADRQARGEPVCGAPTSNKEACGEQNVVHAPQPQQIPEGYKLVPIEPTDAMLKAAQTAWLNDPARRTTTVFRAMLEAAPEPKGSP